MRDILIDIGLVLLLLFSFNSLFGNNRIQDHVFNESVTVFEEKITNQEVVNKDDSKVIDNSDNSISLFIKGISDFCIDMITEIVLIISNFFNQISA